jgi:hypothetical protein
MSAGTSPPSEVSPRVLTIKDLVEELGAEEASRLISEAVEKAMSAPFSLEALSESTLRFTGPISHKAADALADALSAGSVRELRVDSIGGQVNAGIRMGHLIRKHGVAVVVERVCMSSCANYLFAAGVKRTIVQDAVVVWHGNAFQKDSRELAQCGRTTSSFEGLPLSARSPEPDLLADQVLQRQTMEATFAQTVGIDDYIARAGQEPQFYGNFTMSVADMARFGLHPVDAPPDYGSTAFCERASRKHGLPLHCIAITDQMLAYEHARRALGEVCQPDGTLRIRTSRSVQ